MSGVIHRNEDAEDYENVTGDIIHVNENAEDYESVSGVIQNAAVYDDTITHRQENFCMELNESYVNHILAQHPTFGKGKLKCIIATFAVLTVLVAALILAVLATSIIFALKISELSAMDLNTTEEQALELKQDQELSASIQLEQILEAIAERVDHLEQYIMNISSNDELNSQIDRLQSYFNEKLINESQRMNALLDQNYLMVNETLTNLQLALQMQGGVQSFPASSCAALPPSSPSGYYWVRASNGSAVRVYCDMTRLCGEVIGGWTRVVQLDKTKSNQPCPSGFVEHTHLNITTCVSASSLPGCPSNITFPTHVGYTQVCGRIIGYQVGTTNAFLSETTSIDSDYVDGVSITHGDPRQHIWTFAAARDTSGSSESSCACISNQEVEEPPSFVADNYFCDTGSSSTHIPNEEFFGSNPLWDGAGCQPPNTCCRFNTPPWFYRQLPQPTTDDIELRVCRDEVSRFEDIAIEKIDLFIQ